LGPAIDGKTRWVGRVIQWTSFFFDNTDPKRIDRVFDRIDDLAPPNTRRLWFQKSGGTKETRKPGCWRRSTIQKKGELHFNKHAVAVTGVGSIWINDAEQERMLCSIPMYDWSAAYLGDERGGASPDGAWKLRYR